MQILNEAGVRYLVVGGVAVVLHGYLRTTDDLDLVIDLENDNVRRAVEALDAAGFRPRAPVSIRDFANPELRRLWVETKNMQVFSLWHERLPGFEVDLFVEAPFDFGGAWERRVEIHLEDTTAAVVSRDDLLKLKRAAGRPRDLDDLQAHEEPATGDGDE